MFHQTRGAYRPKSFLTEWLEKTNKYLNERVLKEWVRVVKVDGTIRISVPSFKSAVEIYSKTGKLENVLGPLVGGQTYDYEFHYCLFVCF